MKWKSCASLLVVQVDPVDQKQYRSKLRPSACNLRHFAQLFYGDAVCGLSVVKKTEKGPSIIELLNEKVVRTLDEYMLRETLQPVSIALNSTHVVFHGYDMVDGLIQYDLVGRIFSCYVGLSLEMIGMSTFRSR